MTEAQSQGANNLSITQTGPRKFADRYEIEAKIGQGGMASLYRVNDLVLKEKFAIKLIHPQFANNDQAQKRFRQEGRAALGLNHPNICTVHAYDISPDGVPYLLMDFVQGKDLGRFLRKGALPPQLFFEIFPQVCGALAHAHSRGVIHRDVKPSNMIVSLVADERIWVNIVDFGIAKLLEASEETHCLTQEGHTVGSPMYMSPEQAQAHKVDARSDIYSLGCVMYEAITGQPPFKAGTAVQITMKHMSEKPGDPAKVPGGNCPAYLDRVILKCLEKNPTDRYQNMFDLRADLLRVKAGHEPLLTSGKGLAEPTDTNADWFNLTKRGDSRELKCHFEGLLSYEMKLDSVLKRVLELGLPGDSILRLESQMPTYTGVVVIRDGRHVRGARIITDGTHGYESLRKLLTMAAGEFKYFTILKDQYKLPDLSMNFSLNYLLDLYPNLPESPSELVDEAAINDLVGAVKADDETYSSLSSLDDSEELDLWDSSNMEAQWRPVESETPSSEFSAQTYGLVRQAQEEHQRLVAASSGKRKSKPEMVLVKMTAVLIAVLIGIFGFFNLPKNYHTMLGSAQGQKEPTKNHSRVRKPKRQH